MSQYNEDELVQSACTEHLCNTLGWDGPIHAQREELGISGTLGRLSQQETILERYLLPKLKEYTPGLPDSAYHDAIKELASVSSTLDLLGMNKEKDGLLRTGYDATFKDSEGKNQTKRIHFFDLDNPERNHFLVVREFWVRGDLHTRRADIMGFVNGIPLVFIECKNANKNIKMAYDNNLKDYKDVVPGLFHHNALVILTNGIDAKAGSISSKFEHFNDWKRQDEDDKGSVSTEVLLSGMCSKKNLMDLFENYILFDESGSRPVKIIARNHQFLGVNRAIESVREREQREGKLGVFWHTQGSGKSYSIVYLVQKIHRKVGGQFTFLILTDREELDTQIYTTFSGCGLADNDKVPCRAQSGEHLKKLLGQHIPVIFTLIQKFNIKDTVYSERDDIIVITDEAHRTQGGVFSLNLRNALPHASFIGFTGTPIIKGEEHYTEKVFGSYVSIYDFQRAVEDNATVPLYYDSRGDYLQLSTNELNDRIAEKLAELEIEDVDTALKLERALNKDYHIITAPDRLARIAQDFVDHYYEDWGGGKAMFVCIDKLTAVKMYNQIIQSMEKKKVELQSEIANAPDQESQIELEHRLQWLRETITAVVISQEQNEVDKFRQAGLDILPHRKLMEKGFVAVEGFDDMTLEQAFKKSDHPFRVAIVCAMWLTGFDVPTLGTLYLDKPMKAHTLMQAIARANRVAEGKTNGLIVDYCGILKNLREALAVFGSQGGEKPTGGVEPDPAKEQTELLNKLEETLSLMRDYFQKQKFDFDRFIQSIQTTTGFARLQILQGAKEAVNDSDNTRKHFMVLSRAFFVAFKAAIHCRPEINQYRPVKDIMNLLYESLQSDVEQADISEILKELQDLVGEQIMPLNPEDNSGNHKIYDISAINFDLLKREFEKTPKKATITYNLKEAINSRLEAMLNRNPLRTDLQQKYQEMIDNYNHEKDRQTIEETFEALMRFVKDLDEEETRCAREGLDEERLAMFDLLKKGDLSKEDIKRIKSVAEELLMILRQEIAGMDHWTDKQGTRDSVKQRIYDYLYDEKTGLPESFRPEEIEDLSQKVFLHFIRAYPQVPSPVYDVSA